MKLLLSIFSAVPLAELKSVNFNIDCSGFPEPEELITALFEDRRYCMDWTALRTVLEGCVSLERLRVEYDLKFKRYDRGEFTQRAREVLDAELAGSPTRHKVYFCNTDNYRYIHY
ncbi:hypothetical protein BXZ70DRAFT_1006733 [Cristinia sonorae]|uniref:Uncharacterized protein n=1 Tax=Cristinia sonorae TaxID=1940300 RepID=A0A8K0UTA4_9AGAR|nr:hypothetical protein BXZ70DRAFT_1006733 [Cristinia sonorae]